MTGSRLSDVFMRLFALGIAFLVAGCSNPVGNDYTDIDALALSAEWSEWVVVGKFGPKGPFTLTETKFCEANVPCSFSHNGQGHTYDGFTDFEMMVLRLESESGEVSHLVLRGEQKVTDLL